MKNTINIKSNYKRIATDIHFKPLSEFIGKWNEELGINAEMNKLADKLSIKYCISQETILRLIRYVLFAYESTTPGVIKGILTDYKQVIQFEKKPEQIISITFNTEQKQFIITEHEVIDELYYTLFNKMFQTDKPHSNKNKKLIEEGSIKKIATELFNELTKKENISEWKSYCIIGFIFAFYRFGIKRTGIIKTENRYNLYREKHYKTDSYLQYLSGNIKRYIIK
jgi:hypothetical protein